MPHLPVNKIPAEEEYFLKLNCELCRNLHQDTLKKSAKKEEYAKEIKALVEKEQQDLQNLIKDGQAQLTAFIKDCSEKHQQLSEKYGGNVSDEYAKGWEERIQRASDAIADLSKIFKD